MKLRKIFSPADARKLAEHARKFETLPAMAQPEGVQYPEHDGDVALLHELADRVFDALDELPDDERLGAIVTAICRHEAEAVE